MTLTPLWTALPEPIGTPRLTLRKPCRGDAGAIAALANNHHIHLMLARLPYPYEHKHAIDFIKNMARCSNEHAYAITHNNGTFMGMIGLMDTGHGTAEIGYWLGEPFWGHGYTTEAAKALIAAALATGQCPPIVSRAQALNTASLNVLEKCGFVRTREGVDDCGHHKDVPMVFLEREPIR